MKKLFLIILSIVFLISHKRSEYQQGIVHLSYNITNSNVPLKKYLDNRGCVNFYIDNEYFKAIETPKAISKENIENIKLITIDSLIALFDKVRRDSIKIGEKKGVLKILSNSDIFKNIYIYEKQNERFFKHRVEWVEQIID